MSAPIPTTNDDRPITMSAADLQRLLADVAQGGGILPPGAYRADGEVWRDVLEPTGRRRKIMSADGKTVLREDAINRKVRRRVLVPFDTSPQGWLEAKRKAQRSELDIWHPKYGWVRRGVKREVDVPENLGTGAERFEMVYVPIPTEDDQDGSSVTMQGVPLDGSGTAPIEPDPVAAHDGPDPFSDESVMAAAAASGGRRPRGA